MKKVQHNNAHINEKQLPKGKYPLIAVIPVYAENKYQGHMLIHNFKAFTETKLMKLSWNAINALYINIHDLNNIKKKYKEYMNKILDYHMIDRDKLIPLKIIKEIT